jgi:hypothetical protein
VLLTLINADQSACGPANILIAPPHLAFHSGHPVSTSSSRDLAVGGFGGDGFSSLTH